MHGPQAQLGVRTDLRIEGHRNRYGEKALKFGGIDMVLRLLQLIPENVTVGYHGVLDLFKPCTEPKAFLHYWPRTKFFLTPETFDRWLAPRLSVESPNTNTTREQICNTLLLRMMVWGESDEAEKTIGLCRSLGAQMTKRGEFLALGLYGSLPNTWTELFHLQNNGWVVESFFHVLRSGPPFAEHARGGRDDARRLLRRAADAGCDEVGGGEGTAARGAGPEAAAPSSSAATPSPTAARRLPRRGPTVARAAVALRRKPPATPSRRCPCLCLF